MPLEDLPEDLEQRILTCSTQNFFNVYNLTPTEYSLRYFSIAKDGGINYINESAVKWMKENNIIAITDFRVSQSPWNGKINRTAVGTAIYVRNKKDPDRDKKVNADGTNNAS